MKKKIQTLVGGLALAAIVGVNCYMATTSNYSASELQLKNIENVAEGEYLDIQGKGEAFPYDCYVWKMLTFDANGNASLPDGSSLAGAALTVKYVYCKYTAVNCGGSSKNYCKTIKCK